MALATWLATAAFQQRRPGGWRNITFLADQLDQVFHLSGDGTFDIRDVPGSSKRDRTLNAYILTGLGTFLTTGQQGFDSSTAREFCEKLGCFDKSNHSTYLKNYRGSDFSCSSTKVYTLTPVGLKSAAFLVKLFAASK